jgi:hypothetical protein
MMSVPQIQFLPQMKNIRDIEHGDRRNEEDEEGIPDRHHQRRSNVQLHSQSSSSCFSWGCFSITLVSVVFVAMQVTVVTMMILAYDNFATNDVDHNTSNRDFLLVDAILTSVFSFLIILFFPLSMAYDFFKIILSFTIFVYTLVHFALGITFIVFFFTKTGWESQPYLIALLVYYFSGSLKCFFANESNK